MLRRREMVLPTESNLIKFDTMTFGTTSNTAPYFQASITKGNHFNIFYYRRSTSSYGYPYISLHEISNTWESSWPVIGEYAVGDFIEMYLKNFTVISQAATTGEDKTDFAARSVTDGSFCFGWGSADTAQSIPNTTGLVGDLYYSATAEVANQFNAFRGLGRNTSSQGMRCRIEFDLWVYINGTRII